MNSKIEKRMLSVIAGTSYLLVFVLAIFANFFVIDSLPHNPLIIVQQNGYLVRLGILAFMATVVFDVVIAWALYELYKDNILSLLSTFFRMMHAAIMGVAIYALPATLNADAEADILKQVDMFNTIWLIALFFFGIHLIIFAKILHKPTVISWFLGVAGAMYMVDTTAHFALPNYEQYAALFLALVALPSMIGEMSLAIWLLLKGGKQGLSD
jgi:hypothetical protein